MHVTLALGGNCRVTSLFYARASGGVPVVIVGGKGLLRSKFWQKHFWEKRLASFFLRCPLLLRTRPSPVPPSEDEVNRFGEGVLDSSLVLL